jgi:predicted TIM-barrel fold metal-dependent hydrolase
VLAANARASTAELPLITADGPAAFLARPLVDLGEQRIAAMDADGIDMQLLLLSSPGVQVFDAETACSLASEANDYAAAACARYPARFAALATLAPQDPAGAVHELERALKLPGMNGAMINSHTFGEYLDAPKYWPLFEALEALDTPLYLHPREPAGAMNAVMTGPVVGGAAWAYGVEVGTHVLRLIQAACSSVSRSCESSSVTWARRCRSGFRGSTTAIWRSGSAAASRRSNASPATT